MRKLILAHLFLTASALVFFFSMANLAFAETKVFVEEYTYQASEYDSKVLCRALAIEQVKRLLLEKLGTYLESETEVKNFQLTKDQIVILTAGRVSAEIMDEKWDGKTYWLKAKISADPNDVVTSIEKLRQDRQKTNELEETRKKADEALKEVERLKRKLGTAKAGKTEQEQYKAAVNRLSATDWVEKGRAFLTAGRFQEAIGAFAKAIELDPKEGWVYLNRGAAYGELGDHRQAIRDYDKAIELDPKDALAYVGRGNAYSMLGDHRQAIRDYDRGIALAPDNSWAYYNIACIYSLQNKTDMACQWLKQAIEKGFKDWERLKNDEDFGNIRNTSCFREIIRKVISSPLPVDKAYKTAYDQFTKGNVEGAKAGFKRFLEGYPKSKYAENAHYWLGECYFAEKKYEEAILEFDEVIKKYPKGNKVPDALFRQGMAFLEMKDTINAKLILREVVKRFPRSDQANRARKELKNLPLAEEKSTQGKNEIEKEIAEDERLFQANEWFEKGYALGAAGKNKEGIEAYTRAIELNPKYAEAYYNRGIAYEQEGQYDRAIEDFNKAIAFDPKNEDAYRARGNSYHKAGYLERARSDFLKACELDNIKVKAGELDNITALICMGNAYFDTDQFDKAIETYRKVLQIDPKNADVRVDLGIMYRRKGNLDRAIEEFKKAAEDNPKHVNSRYNLGIVYLHDKGDLKAAIKAWEDYLRVEPTGPRAENIRNQLSKMKAMQK